MNSHPNSHTTLTQSRHMPIGIWASARDVSQRAFKQIHHSIRYSQTQSMHEDEGSKQRIDLKLHWTRQN